MREFSSGSVLASQATRVNGPTCLKIYASVEDDDVVSFAGYASMYVYRHDSSLDIEALFSIHPQSVGPMVTTASIPNGEYALVMKALGAKKSLIVQQVKTSHGDCQATSGKHATKF